MNCREGENEKHWFRSGRFFVVNRDWYFTTREKIDVGPFGSEAGAQQGLKLFIEKMQSHKLADPNAAAAAALQGQWATTFYQ